MALLSPRSWDEWIGEYARGHQNLMNRRCHTVGIPMIALSLVLGLAATVFHSFAYIALALFAGGWILQFVGHAYEGTSPEFLKDWRFLFVGLRWWVAKVIKTRGNV